MNERIRREILARLEQAQANFPSLPESLKPLLDYYEQQSIPALARELVKDLEGTFIFWKKQEYTVQAAGFEWYYDGTDLPDALGYGFESVKVAPDLSLIPIGSNTHQARADFDGGVQFGQNIFGDSGGFDLPAACFPFFHCQITRLEQEADEEWEALQNLYTLRLFYCMHLALGHLSQAESFRKFTLTKPFYFFANNHDWSPFLLFCYDGEPASGPEYELTGAGVTRVESLNDWVHELAATTAAQETRGDLIGSMLKKTPAEIEAVLLQLPELKAANGESVTLTAGEMKSFVSQKISDPEYYEKISFEALQHLFELTSAKKKLDLFDIHSSMIYLFLNAPERALEYFNEVMEKNPKKIKEVILDCAKNSLRWAGDRPEHRWPNPNLALSKSAGARKAMQQLLES